MGNGLISFDAAVELIRSVAQPLGTEMVPIASAAGRVLAAPIIARIDSPRADVSAMDGYAVRDADVAETPARLRIVGESFAGAGWNGTVAAGECARIFTGAPVPAGADRVVIQENVERDGDMAVIAAPCGNARHIRKRGSDFREGDALLEPGRLLDPRAVVAAAAADLAELTAFKLVKVALLSTGDELGEPGSAAARADAIPESVSFGIAALASNWGGSCALRWRLPDDLQAMEGAAGEALAAADLVVVTGGASVGEKDFAKTMFEPHGLELIFSKVAIKPGKPVWLGRAGGKLIIGLPGNPTSAMVTARLLLAPLLVGLAGRPIDEALRWRSATLATPLDEGGARETFHRAVAHGETAAIIAFQDSSAQKALAQADLLVRQRPDAPALAAGERVEVLDF